MPSQEIEYKVSFSEYALIRHTYHDILKDLWKNHHSYTRGMVNSVIYFEQKAPHQTKNDQIITKREQRMQVKNTFIQQKWSIRKKWRGGGEKSEKKK